MIRLTLTLAVWMVLVPVASASVTPRSERPAYDNPALRNLAVKPRGEVLRSLPAKETTQDFTLTEQTEVLLDGKPCRFQDLPAQATIVGMEVAADRKTVLKVRFRSGK
jgi:hypothetical protein